MGLMQVKEMSEETADAVVRARGRKRFSSLEDFWRRTALDRDAVENLIAVGAFDTMGVNRRKLLWQLEEIARTVSRQRAPQQRNLVRYTGAPVPQLPALTELDVAGLDFTIQGASAQYSIMSFYRRSLTRSGVLSIGQLQMLVPGSTVVTAGIVISRQQPPTAKGMTFLVLSDEEGELPVAVYPSVFAAYRSVVNGSASLIVEGTVQRERYVITLLARRLWRLDQTAQLDTTPARPGRRGYRLAGG